MTILDDSMPMPRSGRRRSESDIAARKSLNRATMGALIALLALVPLPFGAVHAFSWGFFALYTGAALTLYMLRMSTLDIGLSAPLANMRVSIALFALYCGYLVLQMAPLGWINTGLTSFVANGMSIESATISVATNQTALMLMRHLTYGALFLLVIQVTQNPARREVFLNAILTIIAIYCLQALVSLQTGDTVLGVTKRAYIGSATGPFVNRNSFATFLAMGAMIALVQAGRNLIHQTERHPHDGLVPGAISNSVLYGVAYLVLVGVVFATNSRMGAFCTLAGSAVVIAIIIGRVVRSLTAVIVLLAAIFGSFILALVLFGEQLFNRLVEVESSTIVRSDLYEQVMQLIAMRPWLGFGGGAFEQAFQIVHQFPVSPDLRWDRAHNSFLSLWSEMGLIAGSLPVLVFVWIGIRLMRALRQEGPEWPIQAVGLAVLVVAGLHSLVDFSLEIQANAVFFVALIAMALGTTFRNETTR